MGEAIKDFMTMVARFRANPIWYEDHANRVAAFAFEICRCPSYAGPSPQYLPRSGHYPWQALLLHAAGKVGRCRQEE
jgi:hypothetical protein